MIESLVRFVPYRLGNSHGCLRIGRGTAQATEDQHRVA